MKKTAHCAPCRQPCWAITAKLAVQCAQKKYEQKIRERGRGVEPRWCKSLTVLLNAE